MRGEPLLLIFTLSLAGGLLAQETPRLSGKPVRLDSIRLDTRPMTVVYEEWLSAPGRQDHLSARQTLAIRGDLATANDSIVFTLDGKKVASHIRELGYSNGDRVRINERLGLLVGIRTPMVFSEDLPLLTAESNCSQNHAGHRERNYQAAGERWLNYRVVKEVRSDAGSRITSWRAPELGCVELRRLAEFFDAQGKVGSSSDLKAVSVQLREPDARWFRIPGNFDHVNFSTHYRRMVEAAGKKPSAEDLAPLARQDAYWDANRIPEITQAGKGPRPSVQAAPQAPPVK